MNRPVEAPRKNALARFASPVVLLLIMWVIQALDAVLPGSFTGFGLRSWDVTALGGTMLAGVIGVSAGISWQAHLFGAIGGGVAVFAGRPRDGAA